jgi:hypothetical protein
MNTVTRIAPGRSAGLLSRFGRALGDLLGVAEPDARATALLQARYGLLGEVAAVDRIVTSHEVELVGALMDRDGLGLAARAIALSAFEQGRRNRLDTEAAFGALIVAEREEAGLLAGALDDLIAMAAADGRLRRSERCWLLLLCERLNMDAAGLDWRIRQLYPEAAAA